MKDQNTEPKLSREFTLKIEKVCVSVEKSRQTTILHRDIDRLEKYAKKPFLKIDYNSPYKILHLENLFECIIRLARNSDTYI